MAPAIPIVSSESSQLPDQTNGALTPLEQRSSAPHQEQLNVSRISSETPSLNYISEPETVNLPLNEPLTSTMREEVRTELRIYWHEIRKEEFCRSLKWAWTSDMDYMLSINSSRDAVKPRLLRKFYNKPTTLYWAHSAQRSDTFPCPRFIWGCIFKEWFRYQDYKPRMDFEQFFANPIRITSTGPSTIFDILETHEYLHNQASLLLDKIKRDERESPRISARPSVQNFKLFPICRAIVMVFDEFVSMEDQDYPDGYVEIDEELQRQNVLMVRTGDESGLSEAINFESVREQALPLARPDLNAHDGIEAIRVTLATAVRFVIDLQRREELAFPESGSISAVEPALCAFPHHSKMLPATMTNADEWVDKLMEIADDEGVENVWEVQTAVSTIKAMHRGESRLIDFWPPYVSGTWR